MKTDVASARALASAMLRAAGMDAQPAARTAWALASAESWGRASHGLLRLPYYLERFSAGGSDPRAVLRLVRSTAVTAVLDGGNGLGHHHVFEASTKASAMAREHGLAAVAVANSGHCGVLGLYVEPMLDAGLVGIVLSTGPAVMPPPGGSSAVVSTSPIAAGIPMRPHAAVVDMAMSAVARGRIAASAAAGEEIPAGWAFDADGVTTTDPREALAGLLAPLGGAKGFALALVVESLTAGIVGPSLATEIADPLDGSAIAAPQRIAHLVLALDPACLDADGASGDRLERLAASVAAAGGRVPGARHRHTSEIADDDELTIPDRLASSLVALAASLGVDPPGSFADR
ncbi:MAG TPA: Ldh family oxidoreductase [Acidimicrobiales bacterium]|nr:Ldh family oxidoreductase [Acidimicrobiales bacterium]HVC26064.1 Ldh family oxidoreductase [Acidimicrobiales bacterium]